MIPAFTTIVRGMKLHLTGLVLPVSLAALLHAPLARLRAELIVGPNRVKTISEGVAALNIARDTLTIMPGEYRETISATLMGMTDAPIIIRGWRAGSVLIRGDVDLRGSNPAHLARRRLAANRSC